MIVTNIMTNGTLLVRGNLNVSYVRLNKDVFLRFQPGSYEELMFVYNAYMENLHVNITKANLTNDDFLVLYDEHVLWQ